MLDATDNIEKNRYKCYRRLLVDGYMRENTLKKLSINEVAKTIFNYYKQLKTLQASKNFIQLIDGISEYKLRFRCFNSQNQLPEPIIYHNESHIKMFVVFCAYGNFLINPSNAVDAFAKNQKILHTLFDLHYLSKSTYTHECLKKNIINTLITPFILKKCLQLDSTASYEIRHGWTIVEDRKQGCNSHAGQRPILITKEELTMSFVINIKPKSSKRNKIIA